jgi:6-phosphofructokinase 1
MSFQPVDPDARFETRIRTLGPCTVKSPDRYRRFVRDTDRVLYDLDADRVIRKAQANEEIITFERAGPRETLFFEPAHVNAAIVTCGGLCPGLNDVIRAIVDELHYVYGVSRVVGIPFGYAGLNPALGLSPTELTPDLVRHIHGQGGTILGSSRGPQPVADMVDMLVRHEVDILFAIGGDGTLKGAMAIHQEITRRRLSIAVVGIPKTIDNDISLISRSFGFDTAVATAVESIRCAHVEAEGCVNGVGIVKLMGRESGFLAATAALAQKDANFVLIPEVPFDIEGSNGLLAAVEKRLATRGHAVVVAAEGAGQEHFSEDLGRDASGNKEPGDIGLLLKERIASHVRVREARTMVRYIDPSYIIRAVAANPNDVVFCGFLGQHAVHAAMAGKTNLVVGSWNNRFVHLPIEAAVSTRKQVKPEGTLWRSVLESTGQPESMVNNA